MKKITLLLILITCLTSAHAKTVNYTLNVEEQRVNITGKPVTALTINHAIPGPTLTASVGDDLRIAVTNKLPVETSIHWHGVLLPNRMDGVPYINSPPIKPGETFVYEFPVKHSGTYWYHAHSSLQEQQGVYGGLVFYPANQKKAHSEEHVVILSDWNDEKPEHVLANLKKDPDYYALKKNTVSSWQRTLSRGPAAIKARIKDSLNRMGPMDISDIGYDAFLINGKKLTALSRAKPGSTVKLRIINAAASSYFILEYSGGLMTVVAADGIAVTPFTAQRIRIAMAETYDVLVKIPKAHTYELRATSEDGSGFAIGTIGTGSLISAAIPPKPDTSMLDHSAHGAHSSHNQHHTNNHQPGHVFILDNYSPLRSPTVTTLDNNRPIRTVTLKLTGSMERYVWTINNTPMYAADKILIKKGENIRFVLINETMMNHPIHLHGHFFRVLNGQGDYSPLKHTVNIPPYETVIIEFAADEDGDWIFHCHNLYHMALGMGGIIRYAGIEPDPGLTEHMAKHSAEHGDAWFTASTLEIFSNFSAINAQLMRQNDYFIFDAVYNYRNHYEIGLTYQRMVSSFLGIYGGGYFQQEDNKKTNAGIIGIRYTLPLLLNTDLRLSTEGKIRFGLGNDHQLTDKLSFSWLWNTDNEYQFIVNYALTKQLFLSGNYDSNEQLGVGLSISF